MCNPSTILRTLIISLVFLIAFVSVSAQTAVVAAPSKSRPAVALLKLNMNGQFAQLTDYPILRNGQSMIPAAVLRSLKLNVVWMSQTKTVTINKGARWLSLAIGEQNTFIQNDKVYVPVHTLRSFSELIVEYESLRNIVFLRDRSYKPDMTVLNQGNLVDARRAVISLPINMGSFKPWQGVLLNEHGYSFKKGEALRYTFNAYLASAPFQSIKTIVEVKNGKAYVVYQEENHVMDYEGDIKDLGDRKIASEFNEYANEFSVFLIKENKQIVKRYEQHIQSVANELRIGRN
jgi:hypothetical protein